MDRKFIDRKIVEYTWRMDTFRCGDNSIKIRREFQTLLCFLRLRARLDIDRKMSIYAELRAHRRDLKKLKQAGVDVAFPFREQRIRKLESDFVTAQNELADVGNALISALDFWQCAGATLADICNLCNRDYEQVLEEIKDEQETPEFSKLIFVYNLDYKDPHNRGLIDTSIDAPLTHAVIEYFRHLALHTPEGRAAAHEAMGNVFPVLERGNRQADDSDISF